MSEVIQGFAFPFRIDPATGGVAAQQGGDKLRENVIHIVLTTVGERVMRRDYGGGARRLLQDPNNDALRAIARREIGRGIERNEPRVEVKAVDVEQDGATLFITVLYTVRVTRETQTVSVPIGER